MSLPECASGFFVDWNGDTRRVESPGDGYSCQVVDKGHYKSVEVTSPSGFVCHEATYFKSIEDVQAAGVVVRLLDDRDPEENASCSPY